MGVFVIHILIEICRRYIIHRDISVVTTLIILIWRRQ